MNLTDSMTLGGALRLNELGVIVAEGADAASFLHGQLTQSMQNLGLDRARLAGYCSPKGRLLASFVACRLGADLQDERIGLVCSSDLLAPTLKRLSMFVLRSRCKLQDGSAGLSVWGLTGNSAAAWLGSEAADAAAWRSGLAPHNQDARWIRLPDGHAHGQKADAVPRWLLVAPAHAPAPELPSLGETAWSWLEVSSGIPRIVAATSDHFVPQMVNFEVIGGVDFQKGCYPGQEVVARSQYRGTLKRRTLLMQSTVELEPGAEVFHSSDPEQPAGEVVLASPAPDAGFAALVEVKLAALESTSGEHGFTARGGELTLGKLPYPLTSPV